MKIIGRNLRMLLCCCCMLLELEQPLWAQRLFHVGAKQTQLSAEKCGVLFVKRCVYLDPPCQVPMRITMNYQQKW